MEEARFRGWMKRLQSEDDRKLKVIFLSTSHAVTLPTDLPPQMSFHIRFKSRFCLNNKNSPDLHTDTLPVSKFTRGVLVDMNHLMFEGTRKEFINGIMSSLPMRSDGINQVKGSICSSISKEVHNAYERGHTAVLCHIRITDKPFVKESDDLQMVLERHQMELDEATRIWEQFLRPPSMLVVFCYGIWVPPEEHRMSSVFVWNGGRDEEEYCAVCMERYVVGLSEIIRLACGHVFHQTCTYKWTRVNSSCPLCRLKM